MFISTKYYMGYYFQLLLDLNNAVLIDFFLKIEVLFLIFFCEIILLGFYFIFVRFLKYDRDFEVLTILKSGLS